MSRPLIVNDSTTPKSLIEIADEKILTHAWRILDEFQSSDTNTGSVGQDDKGQKNQQRREKVRTTRFRTRVDWGCKEHVGGECSVASVGK